MPPKKVSMIDPDFYCRTPEGWFQLDNSTWEINHDIRETFYPEITVKGELNMEQYITVGRGNSKSLATAQDILKTFNYNEIPKSTGLPKIWKVIFNPPATIVIWDDLPTLWWGHGGKKPKRSKTVVKCGDGDIYDPEKGLAMCIAKKALGNQGNYFNTIKKWTEPWIKEQDSKEPDNDIMDAIRGIIEKCSFRP